MNNTYEAVLSMLSRHPKSDIESPKGENSLLSIFTQLGWNSIWIGTQSLTKYFRGQDSSIYDEVNVSIVPGGSALYALSSYDEVMLPYMDNIFRANGKNFVVVHTSGSHWNYGARYPKSFAYFKPVCEEESGKKDHSACSYEGLMNSYDNSIRYTDFVLNSIIAKLEDKNAFLIYVSDHGESLGEDGFYGHGAMAFRKEQEEVPLIVWFSDKYLEKRPHLKYLKIDSEISHDNVFHSMLDCASISSNILQNDLSICSKKNYAPE